MNCSRMLVQGIAVGVMLAGVVGCSTMDGAYRGGYKMMDPDKMNLKVATKWLNPMTNIREVGPDKRVVYMRWKNSSGSPLPSLQNDIKARFEQAGYRVTLNPDEAWYKVQLDVRYFGDASQKVGTMGTVGGAVVGGVAGGVIGHSLGDHSGLNTGIGAVAGAVVVGGAMNILANRNKMIEYDLVVDVRIGERVQGGVQTNRQTKSGAETGHSAAFNAAGGSDEYGSSSAQSSEDQAVSVRDDFFYHNNTLTAYAVRMGLKPEEAVQPLCEKLVTGLGDILP